MKKLPENHDVELGRTYLYEEDKPLNSFQVFFNTVSDEVNGLLITRTNPSVLKKTFPDMHHNIKIYWLTDIESTEPSIDPTEIEQLDATITGFVNSSLKNNTESIILLDGMEYIISRNSFNQTLQLIHHIKDFVSMYNTLLIIPVSPNAIDIKELKQLERELEIIKFV